VKAERELTEREEATAIVDALISAAGMEPWEAIIVAQVRDPRKAVTPRMLERLRAIREKYSY